MKKNLILFLGLFALVGCSGKEEAMKGSFDVKGVITDIDIEENRLLVEDEDKGLTWTTLHENGHIGDYEAGQEIVVWVDGGIAISSPAQAKALNIEILEKKKPTLSKFSFKNHEFPPEFTGFIRSGENRYQMAGGGYRWTKGNQTVMTDHAGPTQIAENLEAIVLEPGSQVSIVIEQDPHLRLYAWTSADNSEALDGTEITVPMSKGRYIYEVVAQWSNGEKSFTVVIEVQ